VFNLQVEMCKLLTTIHFTTCASVYGIDEKYTVNKKTFYLKSYKRKLNLNESVHKIINYE